MELQHPKQCTEGAEYPAKWRTKRYKETVEGCRRDLRIQWDFPAAPFCGCTAVIWDRPKSSSWFPIASYLFLSSHFSKKVDSALKAHLVFSNSIRKTFILIPTDTAHTHIRKIKGHCKSDCFQWSDQLQTEAIQDALKLTGCGCPEALSHSATLPYGSSEIFLGIFFNCPSARNICCVTELSMSQENGLKVYQQPMATSQWRKSKIFLNAISYQLSLLCKCCEYRRAGGLLLIITNLDFCLLSS